MFQGFPTDRSYSTAAVRDSTTHWAYASWDLPAGHIQAEVQTLAGIYSEVQAVDRFQVVGVPPGTPLDLTARLRVRGWIGDGNGSDLFGEASVSAALQEGSLTGGWAGPWMYSFRVGKDNHGTFLVDTTLATGIQTTAHDEFQLSYSLLVQQGRHGSSRFRDQPYANSPGGGFLSFDGLPAGASIVSCQGFSQGFPVPTLQTSWGGVKARYRK